MIKVKPRGGGGKLRQLMHLRPRTAAQLHRFVSVVLGLNIPRQVIDPSSTAPFTYLVHTMFEGRGSGVDADKSSGGPAVDAVMWANRGGGKTLLGAVATVLDLLFKPGIQVRILGGSLEQSAKMYEYLADLLDRPMLRGVLATTPTQRRVLLASGSCAQMLAQSHRSVRGTRVHKLRCDEVEEFRPDVWEAAQLVTRSGRCGEVMVRGGVEALSTMHRPFGLMSKLVERNAMQFKWNALDVIGRCPDERQCNGCALWEDCRGRAKSATGFISVDDMVDQWYRSSNETWAAEMMCKRPRLSDSVYPNFSLQHHVRAAPEPDEQTIWVGGMDFGLRNPTVMLWAMVSGQADGAVVHVVDEYIESGLTMEQYLRAIEQRSWPQPRWLGVDPAGNQRNSHTGLTTIDLLCQRGYRVRSGRASVRNGIEHVRRRLDRGLLYVDPRCEKLIKAMRTYHFDTQHPERDEPVKDGPDHACDALRYLTVNLECGQRALRTISYL